jgi:hypothetical protein
MGVKLGLSLCDKDWDTEHSQVNRDEAERKQRKLHNEQLQNIYQSNQSKVADTAW